MTKITDADYPRFYVLPDELWNEPEFHFKIPGSLKHYWVLAPGDVPYQADSNGFCYYMSGVFTGEAHLRILGYVHAPGTVFKRREAT